MTTDRLVPMEEYNSMSGVSHVQPITDVASESWSAVRSRPVWLSRDWLAVLPFFLFIMAFLLLPASSVVRGAVIDDSNKFTAEYMRNLLLPLYSGPYVSTIEISIFTAIA